MGMLSFTAVFAAYATASCVVPREFARREQECARLQTAPSLEERAQRAVDEVLPWPRRGAWTLYFDVLQQALAGRDTMTVPLGEVRRIPGGSALLENSVGYLLSSGWAERRSSYEKRLLIKF